MGGNSNFSAYRVQLIAIKAAYHHERFLDVVPSTSCSSRRVEVQPR